MHTKAKKDPYLVKLSEEDEKVLTKRLVDELRLGLRARAAHIDEYGLLDFYWALYEQQPQKGISRDTPRYGSADLTSPIATENVDALSARAVKTVMVEPVWIVEGVGASAKQAGIVEEFLQWRQESMRLQQTLKRAITSALVETGAVIEVCEDAETVTKTEVVQAQPMRDELGNIVLDAKTGKPLPMLDERGKPVPAEDPSAEHVEVKWVYPDVIRRGAFARRRSMKDFLFLPSHAEDAREVWGRATRFYMTQAEVKRREEAKQYRNVDKLTGGQERDQRAEHDRAGISVEVSHGEDLVEHELWRVQFWWDLGKGYQCYTAVVSEKQDAILELRCDWLGKWRTVYVNPYPCPYSVYGYSMVGTKLLTTTLEHTAWRNMNADRSTLKANAPILRKSGSRWDPEIQPFGAGEVFEVDGKDDISTMPFEDVTAVALNKEAQCVTDAQRIIGMNDIAIGQVSEKSRTLGENEMATRQSFTRTDDPIGNIQEAIEELGEVIHAIEVQALKEQEDGVEAPAAVASMIKVKSGGDTSFDGTFTWQMVNGTFRFKPRGSVEMADPNKRVQKFMGEVKAIQVLPQLSPPLAMRYQSAQVADALNQEFVDVMGIRDKQPFLAPLPPPPMPMGMPGAPGPGGPPMGPGGPPQGAPQFGGQELLAGLMSRLDGAAPQ
jgi:hypothetical protein